MGRDATTETKAVWVDVSVMAEVADGPEFGVHELAKLSHRASEASGRSVLVRFLPLGTGALGTELPMSATLEQIGAARAWMPVVSVDGEKIPSKLFYLDGRVREDTKENLLAARGAKVAGVLGGQGTAVEDLGRGLFGEISSALTPDALEDVGKAGEVVRVWIEIIVRAPDSQDRTYQRDVFDTRDEAVAKPGRSRVLGLPGSKSSHFDAFRVLPQEFLDRAFEAADRADAAITEPTETRNLMSRTLLDAALAERYQLVRWSWRNPETLFVDWIQITSVLQSIARAGGDRLRLESGFDIVENGADVLLGAETDVAFSERLKQGVADTVAEITRADGLESVVTAACFQPRALCHSGIHDVELLGMDGRREILVFPLNGQSSETATAWRRIDAATGQTLGVDARGQGGNTLGYTVATATIVGTFFVHYNLYDCLHARELSGWAGDRKDDVNRFLKGQKDPPDIVGFAGPAVHTLCASSGAFLCPPSGSKEPTAGRSTFQGAGHQRLIGRKVTRRDAPRASDFHTEKA
ncbi:MAG: hypothetical protein NXH97_23120 [Rhodobacteraceae bacterium]|nr:hypothetical protein [Paracoccaceae bacterium]